MNRLSQSAMQKTNKYLDKSYKGNDLELKILYKDKSTLLGKES